MLSQDFIKFYSCYLIDWFQWDCLHYFAVLCIVVIIDTVTTIPLLCLCPFKNANKISDVVTVITDLERMTIEYKTSISTAGNIAHL